MNVPSLAALRGFPWYPTLVLLAWASAIYADYPVPFETAPRILIVGAAIGLLVTTLWVALIGSDRGGVAAAITLMGLVAASDPARVLLVMAGVVLLLVERAWSISGRMRLRVPWPALTRTLNVVLVVLLAMQVGRSVIAANSFPVPEHPEAWTVGPGAAKPDIFVIIADGHGRRDVLRESYGYDGEAFAATMRAAGFVEAPSARSNHTETKYALSVLLNGRPLSELGQDMAAVSQPALAFGAVLGNSTFQMLDGAGYETTVIWSGYDHLSLRGADRFIDTGIRNEPERGLWTATAIGRAYDLMTGSFVTDEIARIDGQFAALDAILDTPRDVPQFVFMHTPSPHPPFILNSKCMARPLDGLTIGASGRGHRAGSLATVRLTADQTRCIDSRLQLAIGRISESRPEAVILLLSDHGPEERLDWLAPDPEAVRERLANMFWARTPGRAGLFPDDVTLVNVMPILANAYLDTKLPLHANDVYLMPIRGNFTRVDP